MRLSQDRRDAISPEQIFSDIPPGIREHMLRHIASTLMERDAKKAYAYTEEADSILGVMVARNVRGEELEKVGQVDAAIELYQANVSDLFYGKHPYHRLRVIYIRRKEYAKAIAVCRAFLDMASQLEQHAPDHPDLSTACQQFEGWIAALNQRLRKA